MQNPATIFIASDFVMDPALDAAAEILAARGHRIIRSPKAVPGRKMVFEPAQLEPYFGAADVVVVSSRVVVDSAVLDAAKRLRGIVFPSIGTESLDIADASRRGLLVANGATAENFQSMAEATVMLMLNLCYDLRRTEAVLRLNQPRPSRLSASMLRGKTIGLIGLGRIATGVAQRLQGWDVNILAYSPRMRQDQAPAGVRLTGLDALLEASDIVSLHTTLTPETRHLIGAAQLRQMKPSAFLINTARGGCVDELALLDALREHRIAGAALDAFAVEPLPPDSALRDVDRLILTPHMVGHTQELFASFAPACVSNVEDILRGDVPQYTCNPEAIRSWQQRMQGLAEGAVR